MTDMTDPGLITPHPHFRAVVLDSSVDHEMEAQLIHLEEILRRLLNRPGCNAATVTTATVPITGQSGMFLFTATILCRNP